MKDLDGSLTGTAGNVIVSKTNIVSGDNRCNTSSIFQGSTVCSNTKGWIRFFFYPVNYYSWSTVKVTNDKNITDTVNYFYSQIDGSWGYLITLEANQTYEISFDYAPTYPTTLSYNGAFFGLQPNEYLIIKHKLSILPDQVNIFKNNESQMITELSMNTNNDGDWYWDNSTRTLSYILHYRNGSSSYVDKPIGFANVKCPFPKCQYPQQEPPVNSRPSGSGSSSTNQDNYVFYWSKLNTWQYAYIIRSGSIVTNLTGTPQDYDSVNIPKGIWVIVDIALPILTTLQIDGILEFNDSLDNTLSVNQILINGQLIIGWENKTFVHNVNIELIGNRSSELPNLPTGFDVFGMKSIGIYGGMDLHGMPRYPSWTKLNATAKAGVNKLELSEPVDWKKDEEIVVTTTSYSAFETETFKIVSVSSDRLTITLNSSLKYNHIVASEKFPNGKSYSIAAGVGLLTRNIKITGGQYSNQYNELFGSRIVASTNTETVYSYDRTIKVLVQHVGFLRISNVEFNLFGQFSTYDENYFAYGVLFSNLGSYDPARPSYIDNSAFHNGFSAAIGILKSHGIPIVNNVFHHTLDYALWIEGNSNILRNNLVALNIWSPTILTNYAPLNKMYFGAIEISLADSAVVENNFIAGTQRIGLHFRGSPCSGALVSGYTHSIKGNTIYGSLIGAAVISAGDSLPLSCLLFSNFSIYKSISAGLYVQSAANLIFDSNILIDNKISIFPQVYTPTSLSHVSDSSRSIIISNNLIIGTSPSFNCMSDTPPKDLNSKYSTAANAYGTLSDGRIGIVWANFLDGHNNAPYYPFFNIISYNYINGLSTLNNNTFAYFKTVCNSNVDAVIASSKYNDDGQMPVFIKNTYLYEVQKKSLVFLHRPNIETVNPISCGDMDCDGLKKNLLTDIDGKFLGSSGSVISASEYGWGNRTGLGDNRIPANALYDSNGVHLNPSSIYKYRGIVRDESSCVYWSSWQAHECHGIDYAMLIIESMDTDTENRRLSPIAILSDNKYIDLINGPGSHTFCLGYSCQKRISTFIALVASNRSYDIYLTSTPPEQLRFRVIQATSSFKIRISMKYTTPNNIDVYKGSIIIQPKNAYMSPYGKVLLKDPMGNLSAFMPNLNDPAGSNYMNRTTKQIFFTLDSSNYIDLVIAQEIYVSFDITATTTSNFFNPLYLVANIALLLNVPPSMIRRVQIVSANGDSSRSVRQISDPNSQLIVLIVIDPPTGSNYISQRLSNVNQLKNITAYIANQYYFGQLQVSAQSMNLTINGLNIQVDSSQTSLKIISRLVIIQNARNCRAQSPCDYQPVLQLVDENVREF